MNTDSILRTIDAGGVVSLRDDPQSRICRDLFGNLVVVSLIPGVPTRLATLSDKRKAVILKT